MIHENYRFEFPGRCFRFHHAAITHAAEISALRAIAVAVEPAVVEASNEAQAVFHLVANDERGGAYTREPSRTKKVACIDEMEMLAWFDDLTGHGEHPLEELSIADGWFAVDAHAGDVLQLDLGHSSIDTDIIERHGRRVVRGPNANVLVAPFTVRLLSLTSEIEISVHWSAWTDPAGVGHTRFQQLLATIASSGWKPVVQPSAKI